jgi:hypothetical protein
MRLSLSHPPEARRLFVVGSVCGIICGLDLRESLHADGVDLRDPVLERGALNLILDLAIPQGAFKCDELPLLERLGELREIAPRKDAMPLGACLVVSFVVLPALLGSDVEDDVLAVVLSGFGFCVLSEAADEDDFVDYVLAPFLWFVPLSAVHALPGGCAVATHSLGDWTESAEGDPNLFRGRSPHLEEARSGFWERERASEGRGCLERGTLNADRRTNRKRAALFNGLSHGASCISQLRN